MDVSTSPSVRRAHPYGPGNEKKPHIGIDVVLQRLNLLSLGLQVLKCREVLMFQHTSGGVQALRPLPPDTSLTAGFSYVFSPVRRFS